MKTTIAAIAFLFITSISFGQINPDFLKNTDSNFTPVKTFELPDFNTNEFSIRLTSLAFEPALNDMLWCPTDNFNPQ